MDKNKVGVLSLKIQDGDAVYINDDKAIFSLDDDGVHVKYLNRSIFFNQKVKASLTADIRIRAERSSSGQCYIKFFADQNYLILKEHLYLRSHHGLSDDSCLRMAL